MNNKSLALIVLSSISLFLTACGGGDSSINNEVTPVARAQPTSINAENWQSAKVIQSSSNTETNVEIVGSELIVNIASTDINQGAHLQIYINTDNKPETGFQFENEAWEGSGVDFLIEDGDLFKSTANNTGWNWNINIGAIDYSIDTDSAVAKIDLALLGDICNNLKVGVMTRDEFWNISTFSPAASQMQNFVVSYCNTNIADTVKPSLTLLGANPLQLTVNDVFTDPGATANDNIDGDITSRIHPKSTVNTTIAGTYEVSYLVSDLAGNSATISRVVIVNEISPPEGIVVDGNIGDWADVPNFSSSADAIMKVSDDEEKLYILITSSNLGENIQVLMDTDNKTSTGLDLSAHVSTWLAGADYMIENNSLDKSKSNTAQWSWDYGIAPIEYIETSDVLEIAIKKSDFNLLANQVPMGFVSRSESWNVNYILPVESIPTYVMQYPNIVNPVSANNDFATTTNDLSVQIDVLTNDSSTTGNVLIVSIPTQPSTGTAKIIQNKVEYTPETTFTGTVTFAYEITDATGNKDTANIKITVTDPIVENLDPIAVNDTASLIGGDSIAVRVIDVLANDSDPENDILFISSVTKPDGGQAFIISDIDTNKKMVRYDPYSDFFGTDTFTYTITDGNGGSATATVTVTVTEPEPTNNPPIAVDDNATTIGINTLDIPVLGNDSDQDNDTLTVVGFQQPANGSISLITATATFKYTPDITFSGTDTFTYTISDGTETDTATVSVTVPPNSPPDAVEESSEVDFDKTITVNVLANDTDIDNDVLTVESIVQPTVGFARLNNDGSIFLDPQGNVASISVIYTVTDGRGGSDIAVWTVASSNPNDGNDAYPNIVNEQVSTPKNTAIFIDVLANDSDDDGDTLVLDQVDNGSNGTTEKVIRNGVLGVLYTPNPNFTGTDLFYYGVHDGFGHNGAGIVNITVTP